MEGKVTKPYQGLHKDSSLINQPEGSYTFAKNAVVESLGGNLGVIANENGNRIVGSFPMGYIPIGETYMTGNESTVFLYNPDTGLSEIGIKNNRDVYETKVRTPILNFSLEHPIDAVYRLRRGCERTIYFVDGFNPPRVYNFDREEDFRNENGNWDADKFSLFRSYDSIPRFEFAEIILEGSLKAGSYYAAVQYLDADLNPTEWIAGTDTVNIYHDNTDVKSFESVRGSTNEVTAYQNFGPTGKAIRFNFSNLDEEYPFYRVAIVEHTTGNGSVTRVIYSSEISTQIDSYTYTGTNGESEGTLEELQQYTTPFTKATHITQLDNRLILSDIEGDQINWCNVQKYASRVESDLVLKEIILNDANEPNNPKRGTVHTESVGYMPGEIYAFTICYLLSNNQISPAFHLPGTAEGSGSRMSTNNKLENTFYVGNDNCGALDYWGVDSRGNALEGTPVRHHRFPSRSEIREPLFTKDGGDSTVTSNRLLLSITGAVSPDFPASSIDYLIVYEIRGARFQRTGTIDLNNYDENTGILNLQIDTSIEDISVVSITEDNQQGQQVDPDLYSGLDYTTRIETNTTRREDATYRSKIMGIRFHNIQIPDPRELNGHQVVGYYICRAERTSSQRTILDTGVLTPLLIENRDGEESFAAHGHLNPQSSNKKKDVFALIHPEHKFRNREYTGTTRYVQEGVYRATNRIISEDYVEDVQPGTSYDSSTHRRRERDSDGYSLHVMTRDNTLEYFTQNSVFADSAAIEDTFYLDTLFSKTITDSQGDRRSIFNVSGDNKIGMLQLNEERDIPDNTFPYVVMQRDLSDPYANFRVFPYYKEHTNPSLFIGALPSETTVFNGDSYISSMRYTSSMLYDVRVRNRRTKNGVLNFVVGVLSIVAGIIITGLSFGTAVAAGVAVAGFGVAQIASGLKKSQLSRVYQDLYAQGLEDTVDDNDTRPRLGREEIEDDEIQYFYDVMSNLWFESNVNMGWRMGNNLGLTDFLDAPGDYEEKSLNSYAIEKVTNVDTSADGGRVYQGYLKAEIYDVNEDYFARGKSKVHFHLGLEYDCCSECNESFPHRTYYSEPSFQEELTDNYRVFLPNNYRDLNGETGRITNIFTIQNNLYLHTEEALWHLPQNYQERVTGDIISFIGTGSYFEIPPRKIVDDQNGVSSGSIHKWGTMRSPHGVLFVSEAQRTVFIFDGKQLRPISSEGMYSWFKDNLPVSYDQQYLEDTNTLYPYRDNPAHPFGTGFLAAYDSRLERFLLTKQDFEYAIPIENEDYRICTQGDDLVVFRDFSQIIKEREENGWLFLGIEDCQLQFQRATTQKIIISTEVTVPNKADIHIFLDASGSFGGADGDCLRSIRAAVNLWIETFRESRPEWEGRLEFHEDRSERWLNYPSDLSETFYAGEDTSEVDIIVISFCNESQSNNQFAPRYHDNAFLPGVIQDPSPTFTADYNNFVQNVLPRYKSFTGIAYPIVFGPGSVNCSTGGNGELLTSKEFLKHSIAAVYGSSLTPEIIARDLSTRNPGITPERWAQMLETLSGINPYPDPGLIEYGWVGKWDRAADNEGNVITPEQFNEDIEILLEGRSRTETEEILIPDIEYDSVPGEVLTGPLKVNKGWTMSWNLKFQSWVSWHSYIPNFYLHGPDRLYSWIQGNDNLWLHNVPNVYQRYYGSKEAYVVEYVSLSNPINTRVWDYVRILTEATKNDVEQRLTTFNKVILYNRRQCSGLLELIVKDEQEDYFVASAQDEQVGEMTIDRNELDWSFNDFRDIRSDYAQPIFIDNIEDLQDEYYTDKTLNEDALNVNKSWQDMERFRDKYLVIRLIFDNFDDVKLLFNHSIEFESNSNR